MVLSLGIFTSKGKISEYMHEEVAYKNTKIGDLISFKLTKNLRELK